MKIAHLFALLALFASAISIAQETELVEPAQEAEAVPATLDHDSRDFESYLDGLVAAQFQDYDLAGMTFALVLDGEVALTKGYGYADLASLTPVDPAVHLFRPGSVSKLVTWTAVMQLVEQGKLDLDADIGTYVTQFELPNNFDQSLTLKHLLTHTPGLEDGAAGYLFADEESDLIPLAQSLEQWMPNQVRQPGDHSSYSNWATALAGLIVANVSGVSFEEYVRGGIFAPLNMVQATFDEPLPAQLANDMSTGYVAKQGALEPFGFEFIKNFGPAGALSASADAMAKFMRAHLNGGATEDGRILEPETVVQMHSALHRHDDNVAAMAHGFMEVWRNGNRFIGHGGDTIAFHSEMVLDPLSGFGIYLSFNAPDGARARSAIINGVIDFYFGSQPPRVDFPELDGSEARILEVSGAYRLNRRSYTKLEGVTALVSDVGVAPDGKGGIIMGGVASLGAQTYREVEPYVFENANDGSRLVFGRDDAGAVDALLIAAFPVIVGDRLGPLESGGNHLLIIALTFLASIFVLINTIRNRKLELTSAAKMGRRLITLAALANMLFACVFAVALAGLDMNKVVFDFPPPGTGLALVFPLVSLVFTVLAVVYLVPVWRSPDCTVWARIRYSYVTLIFVLFLLVLNYWNMLGWKY